MPDVVTTQKITADKGWSQIMRAMSRQLPAGFARIGTRANTLRALRTGAKR